MRLHGLSQQDDRQLNSRTLREVSRHFDRVALIESSSPLNSKATLPALLEAVFVEHDQGRSLQVWQFSHRYVLDRENGVDQDQSVTSSS